MEDPYGSSYVLFFIVFFRINSTHVLYMNKQKHFFNIILLENKTMNKCNKGMGGTDMPCKWLKDFNPPIQPIDVFGSGHRPDSEPMKWISKAVTAKTKTADKKVRTWTILGQRDGSKGAFGIFDETEDFESDFPRYSAAYYPKATFKEVIAHYKGIPTDHVIALGDVEYFDITDEIQLGIWKECFNYHQENRYQ